MKHLPFAELAQQKIPVLYVRSAIKAYRARPNGFSTTHVLKDMGGYIRNWRQFALATTQ